MGYVKGDFEFLGVLGRVGDLDEEFLVGFLVFPEGVGPGDSEFEIPDDEFVTTEEALFGVVLTLELEIEVPELILGTLVGLHLLVLQDGPELGRNRGDDILEGQALGQPSHEHLVGTVPFPEVDLVVVIGEFLEGDHLFNFGGGHHQECLVLALLATQKDILGPQASPGQQPHYQRFHLPLPQNRHLVQHYCLTLHGLHITNQFNIFI